MKRAVDGVASLRGPPRGLFVGCGRCVRDSLRAASISSSDVDRIYASVDVGVPILDEARGETPNASPSSSKK